MNPFTRHPASLNESYLEHMRAALFISVSMIVAGVACLIHSVFPFLFTDYANRTVTRLNEFYQSRKGSQ